MNAKKGVIISGLIISITTGFLINESEREYGVGLILNALDEIQMVVDDKVFSRIREYQLIRPNP